MDALHIYGKLPEASDAKCCSGEKSPRRQPRGRLLVRADSGSLFQDHFRERIDVGLQRHLHADEAGTIECRKT
jgi:hypothetical protein